MASLNLHNVSEIEVSELRDIGGGTFVIDINLKHCAYISENEESFQITLFSDNYKLLNSFSKLYQDNEETFEFSFEDGEEEI